MTYSKNIKKSLLLGLVTLTFVGAEIEEIQASRLSSAQLLLRQHQITVENPQAAATVVQELNKKPELIKEIKEAESKGSDIKPEEYVEIKREDPTQDVEAVIQEHNIDKVLKETKKKDRKSVTPEEKEEVKKIVEKVVKDTGKVYIDLKDPKLTKEIQEQTDAATYLRTALTDKDGNLDVIDPPELKDIAVYLAVKKLLGTEPRKEDIEVLHFLIDGSMRTWDKKIVKPKLDQLTLKDLNAGRYLKFNLKNDYTAGSLAAGFNFIYEYLEALKYLQKKLKNFKGDKAVINYPTDDQLIDAAHLLYNVRWNGTEHEKGKLNAEAGIEKLTTDGLGMRAEDLAILDHLKRNMKDSKGAKAVMEDTQAVELMAARYLMYNRKLDYTIGNLRKGQEITVPTFEQVDAVSYVMSDEFKENDGTYASNYEPTINQIKACVELYNFGLRLATVEQVDFLALHIGNADETAGIVLVAQAGIKDIDKDKMDAGVAFSKAGYKYDKKDKKFFPSWVAEWVGYGKADEKAALVTLVVNDLGNEATGADKADWIKAADKAIKLFNPAKPDQKEIEAVKDFHDEKVPDTEITKGYIKLASDTPTNTANLIEAAKLDVPDTTTDIAEAVQAFKDKGVALDKDAIVAWGNTATKGDREYMVLAQKVGGKANDANDVAAIKEIRTGGVDEGDIDNALLAVVKAGGTDKDDAIYAAKTMDTYTADGLAAVKAIDRTLNPPKEVLKKHVDLKTDATKQAAVVALAKLPKMDWAADDQYIAAAEALATAKIKVDKDNVEAAHYLGGKSLAVDADNVAAVVALTAGGVTSPAPSAAEIAEWVEIAGGKAGTKSKATTTADFLTYLGTSTNRF